MNISVYKILEDSCLENSLSLPYWIYRIENIGVSNKRFLKVFLFNKENNDLLDSITFLYNGKEYHVDSFNTISDYNDPTIVGFSVEVQPSDFSSTVSISKETVNGIDFFSTETVTTYNSVSFPEKDDYICLKNPKYAANKKVFPQINDCFWQCACGRIHALDNGSCVCGMSLKENEDVVHFDFKDHYINDYLQSPISYDIHKSFDENIEDYKKGFVEKYGLEESLLDDRIHLISEQEKYNFLIKADIEKKKRNKKTITVLTAVISLLVLAIAGLMIFAPDYREYVKYRFFTGNLREKYIGLSELDVLNSEELSNRYFKEYVKDSYEDQEWQEVIQAFTNDNKYVTSISSKGVSEFVSDDTELVDMYMDSRYQIVLNNLKENTQSSIDSAIKDLNLLGDYKDCKDKLNDAEMAYVKLNYNNDNRKTFDYLSRLKEINYPGAGSAYRDLYDWKYRIIVNQDEYDETTDLSSVDLNKAWYFHIFITGGKPGESIRLSSKGDFPQAIKDLYVDWDSDFYDGAIPWANFWYDWIGSYSDVNGRFTFYLYDENGNTVATKSVNLR